MTLKGLGRGGTCGHITRVIREIQGETRHYLNVKGGETPMCLT